jgi:hypothetical protein
VPHASESRDGYRWLRRQHSAPTDTAPFDHLDRACPSINSGSSVQSGVNFAPVLAACEQDGAASLLPDSNGQDSSAVPDNSPAICGCWTRWMANDLSNQDQQTFVGSVEEAEQGAQIEADSLDLSLMRELGDSLQACDFGNTPGPPGPGSTTAPAPETAPQPSVATTSTTTDASPPSAPSATSTSGTGETTVSGATCGTVAGGNDDSGNGTTLLVQAGPAVTCSTARTVIADLGTGAATRHSGIALLDTYYTVDGWHCPAFNQDHQYCYSAHLTISASLKQAG